MSKEVTASLSGKLEHKKQELLSSQQTVSVLETQLSQAKSKGQEAQQKLSQASLKQSSLISTLDAQTQSFSALSHLFVSYSKSKGMQLNPSLVVTQMMSAEELASTDIMKESCRSRYKEGFDLALEKITNLDYQDSDGRTILMYAAMNGFHYGVEKLLKKGVNVSLVDKQGVNALIYSATLPHIKYMQAVAKETKNINFVAEKVGGCNALHLVVINTKKVMFASELSTELKDKGRNFDNLYHLVLDEPSEIDISWNIKNVTVQADSSIGASGLKFEGDPVNHQKTMMIVDNLVSLGADINAPDSKGHTPFFLACSGKLNYVAHQLLDKHKLDFSITDKAGYNSLHWAVNTDDVSLVKKVIAKGVDINSVDDGGNTALVWATHYNMVKIADLLFNKYGAKDIVNKYGYTAWDSATFNANKELTDVFISKKGINPEAVKLWCAARKGDLATVEEQIKKGVSLDSTIGNYKATTPLIQAVIFGHVSTVQTIVNSGANINKPDQDDISPLYYSLGYDARPIRPIIVKFLVSKGADLSQPAFDGDTPLHMAGYRACTGAIKLLVERGAKVDTPNKEGKTPLHVLIEQQNLEKPAKLTAIKYLLSKSASPVLKDSHGHDAIYLAKQHFPEASPWVEGSSTLPLIGEFESTITELLQEFTM